MKTSKECALEKSAASYCCRVSPSASRSPATSGKKSGSALGGGAAAPSSLTGSDILELPLRESAEQLIVQAMEAELRLFRAQFGGLRDAHGREMIVRNGFHPARRISTAIGSIAVRLPKLRRRDGDTVTFRSLFIPRYVRRADAADASRQYKYLNALRLGNVTAALDALFNGRIRYVPTPVMEHLRLWWARHCDETLGQAYSNCLEGAADLWADVVLGTGADTAARECVLAVVGGDKAKRRRFLSLSQVERSSVVAWRSVLVGLKESGLRTPRKIVIGARADGFDEAFAAVFASASRLVQSDGAASASGEGFDVAIA